MLSTFANILKVLKSKMLSINYARLQNRIPLDGKVLKNELEGGGN